MCSEVERDNPRSRQGQFTCCQPTWLKTLFNLDALYLVWSFSMVLVAAWLGSSENWKLQWTRGVSKLTWNYQCFNPNRPGFGVKWECGDTPVRISTHTPGAYRGPEGQGFLSSMGSVCLGPLVQKTILQTSIYVHSSSPDGLSRRLNGYTKHSEPIETVKNVESSLFRE